jgi:transposase InsO family protein
VICAYIDAYRSRFGVEPICVVLTAHGITIAPSTYYARRRCTLVTQAEWDQAHLVNTLVDLHRANWGVYGQRKMWHAARRAGLGIGRDQVGRLMTIAGLSGVVRGHHKTVTTRPDAAAPRHPDLVRRGWRLPTAPDQLWVADFSYVWTLAGSSTSRSSLTSSPDGSWAGGSPPAATPTSSLTRCAKQYRPDGWPVPPGNEVG